MGSYAQAVQHKQALSDQELEGKINELVDSRKAIQAKLPTLLDDKGQPTPEYQQAMDALTQNAQALREIYHPQVNPSAVSRFGHILTDSLHITRPEDRAKQQASRQAAGAAQDVKTAQGLAAAAPPSPAQTAAQQTQAEIARQNAINDARIKWLVDHKAPQEVIDQAVQAAGGVPPTKAKALTGSKPYKGADGKYYQSVENADGTISAEPMPADYNPPPTSVKLTAPQLLQDSYLAKLGLPFGTAWDTLSNAQRAGFELYKNGLAQRSSNRQTAITDRDGNVHIVDLSSSSGPVEVAPRGPAPTAQGGAGAAKANPQGGTGTKPTKEGLVLNFKKATPGFTKANNTYLDADRISKLGDKWIQHPNSEADANFVLALIRSEAGRVNQQEIAQMFNAGGIAEMPDRWAAKAGHGELPPDLRKQIVDFVHLQKDAAKEVVDEMNAGSGAAPSGVGTNANDPLGVLQ